MRRSPPDLPDLGTRDLAAVLAVARHRSFFAAALTLQVSQSALTRTIQRLERVLGVALFRRSTRRVEVTAEGRELAALAERVLADLRIGTARVRASSASVRGQVVVSAVMSIAHTALPEIVRAFRAAQPQVEVRVREGVHGGVLEDVRVGAADLGISYVEPLAEGLAARTLVRERFHAVLPADHALATSPSLRLAELVRHPLVGLPAESRTRRLIEEAAAARGLTLDYALTVSQFSTLVRFVQAGAGLAIVPGGALPEAIAAGLVARPLAAPKLERALGIVTLRARAPTWAARLFADEVARGLRPRKPR